MQLDQGARRPLVIDEMAMVNALLDAPAGQLVHVHHLDDLSVDAFGIVDRSKAAMVLRRIASAGIIRLRVNSGHQAAISFIDAEPRRVRPAGRRPR